MKQFLVVFALLVATIPLLACSAAPMDSASAPRSAPVAAAPSPALVASPDRPRPVATSSKAAAPVAVRGEVFPDFPWPPPPPSGRVVLPHHVFEGQADLKEVGNLLTTSLDRAGYAERSFYRAPNGFALVARLERINSDGSPAQAKLRYVPPDAAAPFSIDTYLASLFFAPKGRYRQIVFVVTDANFATVGAELTPKAAGSLLREGADRLPASYRSAKFTQNHEVIALIYEFLKGEHERDVTVLVPGRLGVRDHLEHAGLASLLGAAPPQ
ncbi:conserved exported hypothetical protein [Candidatus Terasakiella magnetica]|nr:conserved exported hypothetical protein [Candidatus Terasakiella magnetica]